MINIPFKKTKSELFREFFLEWSKSTTSHGLPKIVSSRSIILKFMWAFFFLSSICFCIYVLRRNISDYYQYEVVTKIRYEDERPIKFPVVTICNLNPYVTGEGKVFIDSFKNSEYFTYPAQLNMSEDSTEIEFKEYLINQIASFSSFTNDYRKKLGFKIDQMILICKFNQKICNLDDFEWVYFSKYGNCFKFNSGYNINKTRIPIKNSYNIGDKYGLNLELYAGPFIDDGFMKSSGFRVFIHDQLVQPLDYEGLTIQTGKCTDLEVNKVVSVNKNEPYSKCKDLNCFKSDLYNIMRKRIYSYRQKDCYIFCYQKYINEMCNCYDTMYPKLKESLKPCFLNIDDVKCLLNKTDEFYQKENKIFCSNECPLECNTTDYELKVSISDYPTNYHYSYLKFKLPNFGIIDFDKYNYEEVRPILGCLNVYFNDYSYTSITEKEKISGFDLVSLIGGSLGLFIGISILSLIELFELLLEIILIFILNQS